jgi:hypothetical protein
MRIPKPEKREIEIAQETVGYLMRKAKEFKWDVKNTELFKERADAIQSLINALDQVPDEVEVDETEATIIIRDFTIDWEDAREIARTLTQNADKFLTFRKE